MANKEVLKRLPTVSLGPVQGRELQEDSQLRRSSGGPLEPGPRRIRVAQQRGILLAVSIYVDVKDVDSRYCFERQSSAAGEDASLSLSGPQIPFAANPERRVAAAREVS